MNDSFFWGAPFINIGDVGEKETSLRNLQGFDKMNSQTPAKNEVFQERRDMGWEMLPLGNLCGRELHIWLSLRVFGATLL